MEWKDSDLDYDINCGFIDKTRFNIIMENNWARSTIGTPAIVEPHTILGAIHPSNIIYFAMKKSLPTREKYKRLRQRSEKSEKRKPARDRDQRVSKPLLENLSKSMSRLRAVMAGNLTSLPLKALLRLIL